MANRVDAIGSVANYFTPWWQGDAAVAIPVQVQNESPELLGLANDLLKPTHSVAEMAQLGVVVDNLDPQAQVLLLRLMGGDEPEYWLGFDDFYVITRYNHSRLYAMAVYQLGQEIMKRHMSTVG